MDDDDSQDELINRSSSHSKGKRAALWAISDDSDNVEEESEEGESDSGEEEEEGHVDGEEEEEDDDEEEEEEEEGNEEDDDEEEEEDAKAEDGAFGGTSVDITGLSSDEDTEKCPICLNSFSSQPVATPENCEHYFCLDCILAWAKNANSCPVDRIAFNSIYLRKCYGGKVKKMITVQKPVKEGQEETVDLDLEQTNCEVCGGSDREDRLLLCDGCDAGYHMECLTPPLDSVPVEEWFCPECEANNRQLRGSAEELSDSDSLPSTAHPATSRSQSGAAGPTRAIARTQQSERVRANVNRHRISQARSSQLAPTYLIQSSWLDDTINAVVSGLNTAVYIRDFTPRAPVRRRRKTGKRRKVKRRKTTAKGKTGKASSTGVKRRKRRVRRTKSRKKMMLKKTATPRSRIASNLRIVKDKKSSSLPTVYRPAEHTLSSMRADIGAASLSIYGDPFDLDPFVDREEEEQQARVTSLLEAKRRGISRSALRSHQPVARPVTASLSRRGLDVPQSGGVVEAAPVPDLLGSILSGQSVLLMDSSDVVINRDGSLKATKPMMPSAVNPGCSNGNSSSGETSTQISPVMSPNPGDTSPSPHYNGDLPGSSHSSMNRPFSQSSSRLPPHMSSSAGQARPSSHSDLPPRGHPNLQPPRPIRPTTHPPAHRRTNGVSSPGPSSSSLDSSSKSKGVASSQSQSKKAPPKPMWVDVSVLPRIPKIKRESSSATNDGASQGGSSSSSSSSRGNSSNSTSSSNGYGVLETGMNSLAGDKGRQQSVDQQKGRTDGQRPDRAGSSSAFSNSFSSSSSSSGSSSVSHPHYSSSSSSSSSVSFRINASGNSWQSRRLSSSSSSPAAAAAAAAAVGSTSAPRREKEDDAKKRQLHRDKQMLLASRTLANKEQESNNIYDPFDPTLSDSSSSDDEAESLDGSSRLATREGKAPRKQDLVPIKTENQETEVSQEEPRRVSSVQETTSRELRFLEEYVKVEKESRLRDANTEKQTSLLSTKVKKEPGLDDAGEAERFGHSVKRVKSEPADTTPPVQHSLDLLKTERETLGEESGQSVGADCRNDSSASSSAPTKKKLKPETKSDSKSSPKSRDPGHKKKTLPASKERRSSSPETDRSRRGDHHASGQGGRQKEKEKDRERSSRRSRSRERRRAHSTSESSQSHSPDRTHRKRRRSQSRSQSRSRSRSKDRRRSRSGSSSSSKERSRRKKHKQMSKERNDDRERDCDRRRVSKDKRHGRSRSKSRSRSRSRSKDHKRGRSRSKSRSRSRERRKDHTRLPQSSLSSRDKVESRSKDKRRRRSRSSSREKRKEEGSSSKSSQKTSGSCVSSSKDTKQLQGKKKERDITQSSLKEEKATAVNKQKTLSSTDASKERKKGKDLRADEQATTAEMPKEMKVGKEIKKEKRPSLDMFEDSFSFTKPIKKEETDIRALMVTKSIDEERHEGDLIKTESFEIKTETCGNKTETCGNKTKTCGNQTETFKIKTETFEIKTETCGNKTKTCGIKTETCGIKTKTCGNKTETCGNKTKTCGIKTETCGIKTKTCGNKTETCGIKTETCGNKTETCGIKTETCGIKTKTCGNKTETCGIKTETCGIKTETCGNKTETCGSMTETFEIKTETCGIKTKTCGNKTKTCGIKTETCGIKNETFKIKTETCEFPVIKSEPSFPESSHLPPATSFSTLTTPATAGSLQDTVSQSQPEVIASREQPDTVGLTVPVKQEVQQPSDSDDDFNVDVMLDNLDYVKSERMEESAAPVKQEEEVEEEKNEQVSTVVGVKSKTQVKRVTWNIQEPEGPQPEKSASKLSLYKLKLKQEGARRPPSTVQTTSQDITGAQPSKRDAVDPLSTSRRDGAPGEAEEGDLSRKDQYLKKLHMQERAIEEVKLAIKPFYQKRDINKEEYKEILRKAVQKVCHSKSGEINPVKVGNLVKAYVDKYKHARKYKKGEDIGQAQEAETMRTSDSP